MREIAVRSGAVSVVALLVSIGFGALTLGDLAEAGVAVTDLLPLVAFPILVAAFTVLVHHRTRRGRVWASDRARWMFAAVTTVAAIVAVVLLALLAAVGFDATAPPAEKGHVLDVAVVVVVGVVVFTGLPFWVFALAALVGPGSAAVDAGTPPASSGTRRDQARGRHPRRGPRPGTGRRAGR